MAYMGEVKWRDESPKITAFGRGNLIIPNPMAKAIYPSTAVTANIRESCAGARRAIGILLVKSRMP